MIGFNALGYLGRLGNQMFQYAALKGIAKNKGYQYCLPPVASENEWSSVEEYYQEIEERENPEERAARIARERKAAQERAKKQQQKIDADNRRVAAATERLTRPAAKRNADP